MPWRRTGDSRHLRWIFFNIFIGFGFHPVPIQLHVFLIAAMYCHYNCSCKCTIVNTWDNQLDLSGDTGMTIEYICGSWTFEDRIGYIEETDHSFRLRLTVAPVPTLKQLTMSSALLFSTIEVTRQVSDVFRDMIFAC